MEDLIINGFLLIFRKFAATQFEALRARRALPCFDEPAMKATYNVTLGHAQEFISLSNMPRRSSETRDGFVYDHFQRTVKMSTYLLVFVVCDFESIHFTYGNGPVKVMNAFLLWVK